MQKTLYHIAIENMDSRYCIDFDDNRIFSIAQQMRGILKILCILFHLPIPAESCRRILHQSVQKSFTAR